MWLEICWQLESSDGVRWMDKKEINIIKNKCSVGRNFVFDKNLFVGRNSFYLRNKRGQKVYFCRRDDNRGLKYLYADVFFVVRNIFYAHDFNLRGHFFR